MDVYFRQSRSINVRVRALEVLEKQLDNWRVMYEQQLIDAAVLPFFEPLPREKWPPVLWRKVLLLLVSLGRRMQCARFEPVLAILKKAATVAHDLQLRLEAVDALAKLLQAHTHTHTHTHTLKHTHTHTHLARILHLALELPCHTQMCSGVAATRIPEVLFRVQFRV
jgi:hypothetical protein